MKTFLQAIYSLFHELGKAKAAAHFARSGNHKAAHAIMTAK